MLLRSAAFFEVTLTKEQESINVGIDSDIKRNGVPEDELPAYTCPEKNSQERWFRLYDALNEKGYSDEDQTKLFGLNYLRVLKTVLK